MASLQDQLMQAGLVDQKKAKKIKQEKRKQNKKQKPPKGQQQTNEITEQAKQSLAEKAARGREINKQKQQEADKKAIQAQIKQLINTNKIDRQQGETPYQFTEGKHIKKIYVTDQQQQQLVSGIIAIAKYEQQHELIPAVVAEKIQQRDSEAILLLHSKSSEVIDEDDPYADYQIPDDLMW